MAEIGREKIKPSQRKTVRDAEKRRERERMMGELRRLPKPLPTPRMGPRPEPLSPSQAALRGIRDTVASPGEAMARAARGVAVGMRPADMALKQLKEMYGEEGLIRMYNKNPKMFSEQINTISNKINKDRNGMKKGGKVKKGYHKMPDGKIMKDSAHKKTAKCTRGDGCAKKGKTKGRMV